MGRHFTDEGGLPIDISALAQLALKCRAYAKALHYKEQEHKLKNSVSCIEALISINKKLDLPVSYKTNVHCHSYHLLFLQI
jgi:FKBP12-rapamycin complex-associated protein